MYRNKVYRGVILGYILPAASEGLRCAPEPRWGLPSLEPRPPHLPLHPPTTAFYSVSPKNTTAYSCP